ncbi:MAG: hypothetical protein KJ601_06800, partial [Nanoarchaeota archaeon]|nr:hypothetical protein [Nanoarchaeota archaeon]
RNDKRQLIEKARADLKEVARLVTQVRTMMPQVTIKEQPKPIPKPVIRPMLPPPKPVTVQPRKKTEIELLESELAEIEKKIKSIA